jgi:hypothetical protein
LNALRRQQRRLGLGCAGFVALVASSCYRAEIDLSELMDGDAAEAGKNGSASAGGGMAGAPDSAADGGASGAATCSDVLDSLQETCHYLGAPSREQCLDVEANDENSRWQGCRFSACHACTELLSDYPYYFKWHPCCERDEDCASESPIDCTATCPAPTERDKHPPCF